MKARPELRGLGRPHRRQRERMPLPMGDPCPYCRRPMFPGQALDADHPLPRVFGGGAGLRWAHRRCNQSAGATLGNLLRGRVTRAKWVDRWS